MRDFANQGRQYVRPEPPAGDGIAAYLNTMFTVAHAPGASHWCTPGHNRGKAAGALALGTHHRHPAAFVAPHAGRKCDG
jgi:hypothetical protein